MFEVFIYCNSHGSLFQWVVVLADEKEEEDCRRAMPEPIAIVGISENQRGKQAYDPHIGPVQLIRPESSQISQEQQASGKKTPSAVKLYLRTKPTSEGRREDAQDGQNQSGTAGNPRPGRPVVQLETIKPDDQNIQVPLQQRTLEPRIKKPYNQRWHQESQVTNKSKSARSRRKEALFRQGIANTFQQVFLDLENQVIL